MTTEKKTIPKFSTPSTQSREIDGQLVSISRLPARRAPAVLSRLLADVGEVVAEILASPDRELDPEIEAAIRGMLAEKAGAQKAIGASIGIIKAIVFSDVLAKVKTFDVGWYIEAMLPKSIAVGGVNIDTMAELDETGIGPVAMMEALWFAMRVNFLPTFAGLATSDGSESPAATESQPLAKKITGKSSLRGAAAKAGRQGRTPQANG